MNNKNKIGGHFLQQNEAKRPVRKGPHNIRGGGQGQGRGGGQSRGGGPQRGGQGQSRGGGPQRGKQGINFGGRRPMVLRDKKPQKVSAVVPKGGINGKVGKIAQVVQAAMRK